MSADGGVAPPATNRGVRFTGSHLDWLEFTVKGEIEGLLEWVELVFGGFSLSARGMWGYASSGIVLGSGRVAWSSDRPDMGLHVSLPATALGRLEGVGNSVGAIYSAVRNQGGHFTRVDLAVDSGSVGMDVVIEAWRAGDLVTKVRRTDKSMQLIEGGAGGRTLMIGSPASEQRLRLYDKAAERLAHYTAVGDLEKAAEVDGATWTRAELQLRGERADALMDVWYSGASLAGFIRGFCDFRHGENEENTSRWEVLDWWLDWLEGESLRRLAVAKTEGDLDAWRAWVGRQVAVTLGCLLQADGGALDWLIGQAKDGWARAPKWKRNLVEGVT